MRPLFWAPITLPPGPAPALDSGCACVWDTLLEAELETERFEDAFAQKQAPKRATDTEGEDGGGGPGGKQSPKQKHKAVQTFTALDGKRAQGVGILMGSTKLDAAKLSRAVYSMDPALCSLEKLRAVYEQRYTAEELGMAAAHLEAQAALPEGQRVCLAAGDRFLHGISQISHFEARVECMLFTSRFAESIFDIRDRIAVLGDACTSMDAAAAAITAILGIVLACGNHMNGGSKRGQADGFNIEILAKLRDVSAGQTQRG